MTDQTEPRYRACPECGTVALVHRGHELDFCRRCLAQGHMYRMSLAEELAARIERNRQAGYTKYAEKVQRALDALNAKEQPHD